MSTRHSIILFISWNISYLLFHYLCVKIELQIYDINPNIDMIQGLNKLPAIKREQRNIEYWYKKVRIIKGAQLKMIIK